jgi:phosphoribosyl 1,2-cyclic phosphodiesterase
MLTFSIQSGSNGNCIYVEAGDVCLLFDAGISGRCAETRMARHDRDVRRCQALIISHDHSDHTRGLGVFHRRFRLPVYVSQRVWKRVRSGAGAVRDLRFYQPGDTLRFGEVAVHTIRTPHDGIDTVCFVVEHERRRLAILTDLGCPFLELPSILGEVHAAYLESNFDPQMLWTGWYPEDLKQRIAGAGGHLSNDEAASLARGAVSGPMQWIALAHLSEENNTPDLALTAHRHALGRMFPLHVASRYDVGDLLSV